MIPSSVLTTVFLVTLAAGSAEAQSDDASRCLLGRYRSYAEAQEQWQRDLTGLIAETTPAYAEVAQLLLEDQLNLIERSLLAVDYLARNDPARLRTDRPINGWLDLDPETTQRISDENARFRELVELGDEALGRPPHPDAGALREAMREKIMPQPEYEVLLADFLDSVERIDLIRCD